MKKKILISANPFEIKVAVLDKGDLVEFHVERKKETRGVAGDIYKGKVVRVLPGMQAAFVDIGLERTAFLHATDIYESLDEFEFPMKKSDGEVSDAESQEEVQESVQAEPSAWFETAEDQSSEKVPATSKKPRSLKPTAQIEDLLKEGQEVFVQVAKEPLGTKGARLTSHISLPGRYLVLMPSHDRVGVSRRIENEKERKRLKDIVQGLRPPNMGFIVRTACDGSKKREIEADMNYLLRLWKSIQERWDKAPAHASVYQEFDITLKTIRDLFTDDVDSLIIESKDEYEKALKFIETYLPDLKSYVELYNDEPQLFDLYGIEIEIGEALEKKVWLKSGGYIVIDQTEALTTVDVNTGKYVGRRSPEDTVFKTNMEAVKEVVYQLRLRNIGGIIIIDFIDMETSANREKVYQALREAVKKDKSQTYILRISELGLVEMTRKRVKESLRDFLCEACPYCEGKGVIKSKETITLEIYKELLKEVPKRRWGKVVVYVHPDIAELLYDDEREIIEDIETRFKKKVVVKAMSMLHHEQFKLG